MASRKSLSKKVRFEIFKRDGFCCQYCGAKPPKIPLEVDHIRPLSKGGGKEDYNLITSCFDCNLLKLEVSEVCDSMEKACCKMRNIRDVIPYFCGICWNKIKERADERI